MPRKKREDTVSQLEDLSGFDTTSGTELSSLTLSHSISLSDARSKTEKRERVNKQDLVSKQLAHDLQVLKIEVSQKNLLIDQIKSGHAEKVEELEEKLSDAIHHGQIIQARLDTQLHLQQVEARKQHADTQHELQAILSKQKQLEEANASLLQKTARVKEELQTDLTLSHEKYMHMKSLHEKQLSIADFVAIRLYETTEPLKSEMSFQKQKIKQQQSEVQQLQSELEQWRERYSNAEDGIQSLNMKCNQLSLALTDTKAEIQHDNYKINNYDTVRSERDQLSGDCNNLKQTLGYLEAANQALTQERDDLKKQTSALQQTLILTNKDKDYLTKQMTEKNHKYKYAEEQRQVLADQLEKMKQQREDMYEKYVGVRDQYKSEYEKRLQEEVDHLRKQTDAEVGKLRMGTKEMYEQEVRSLREARDMALIERERIQSSERELRDRLDALQAEYQTLQSDLSSKISDIHNQLKLKTFELERAQLLYEETVKNLKASQFDKEKLQKKLEVVTKDVMTLENSTTKRVQELENECSHLRQQLTAYQQIEQHLDDVMLQAAEIGDDIEAERVISAYESQFPVQTTAKRHLQQSVRLAQRVLTLQKKTTTLQDGLDKETKKRQELEGMLEESSSLLHSLQQPQNYLIEVMRNKDGKIQELTKDGNQLKEEIKQLHSERKSLLTSKQQLAADLEKLLGHGEELRGMKETLRTTLRRTVNR